MPAQSKTIVWKLLKSILPTNGEKERIPIGFPMCLLFEPIGGVTTSFVH